MKNVLMRKLNGLNKNIMCDDASLQGISDKLPYGIIVDEEYTLKYPLGYGVILFKVDLTIFNTLGKLDDLYYYIKWEVLPVCLDAGFKIMNFNDEYTCDWLLFLNKSVEYMGR